MKVPSINTKKLDDRSIQVVNHGSEPGTKAYRQYDPVRKRVHVSRDVVFEETKGWSWAQQEDFDSCNSSSFSVSEMLEREMVMRLLLKNYQMLKKQGEMKS